MPEASTASTSIPYPETSAEMFFAGGAPSHSRRLTDKILAAFSHAYSIGELQIAEKLKELLAGTEERENGLGPGRRHGRAVEQAELWVAFVENRNHYREVKEATDNDSAETATAFEEMKEAYRRWSSR